MLFHFIRIIGNVNTVEIEFHRIVFIQILNISYFICQCGSFGVSVRTCKSVECDVLECLWNEQEKSAHDPYFILLSQVIDQVSLLHRLHETHTSSLMYTTGSLSCSKDMWLKRFVPILCFCFCSFIFFSCCFHSCSLLTNYKARKATWNILFKVVQQRLPIKQLATQPAPEPQL